MTMHPADNGPQLVSGSDQGRPDMIGDDAVSLTALLRDYGGPLCEITRTPQGYRAARRRPSAPPVIFTAATVPALRELLEHGYDPAKLVAVVHDFGGEWQVEHIDPGSAWIALSRGGDGLIRVVAADDLDTLRGSLGRSPDEVPGAAAGQQVTTVAVGTADAGEQLRRAGHAARTMPLGDPDDWIRIAARAGATAEEIAEAGRVTVGHVRTILDANGAQR
jgi:hypothetical protein